MLDKIMIAVESEILAESLKELLREFTVSVCSDHNEILNNIRTFLPDILVLDTAMPGCDGISILRAAAGLGIQPAVIALSPLTGYFVQTSLEQLGAAYLVRKPCDAHAVAARVTELSGCPKEQLIPYPDERTILENMLLALDLTRSNMGFDCLLEIIPKVCENPKKYYTKMLYPEVGHIVGSSPEQVERGIRTAILSAWKRRNEQIWLQFLPGDESGHIPKPSNGEFIMHLANAIALQRDFALKRKSD